MERSRRTSWYQEWKPYVSVAKRRAKAAKLAARLAKKEKRELCPVQAGRKMSSTFWGQAWCENLEQYSDYSNRLPRGRTYARNGSVIDLQIERGKVRALVSGSEVYEISIAIKTLSGPAWKRIKQDCSQSIDSLLDLLQGRFDQGVMQRLTHPDTGLFPKPAEIELRCSCPDSAGVCKHIAATMYCVGTRLDTAPELLFTLRAVDHLELIGQAVAAENLDRTLGVEPQNALSGDNLGELFGIELDSGSKPAAKPPRRKRPATVAAANEIADGPILRRPPCRHETDAKSPRGKLARKETAEKTIAKPQDLWTRFHGQATGRQACGNQAGCQVAELCSLHSFVIPVQSAVMGLLDASVSPDRRRFDNAAVASVDPTDARKFLRNLCRSTSPKGAI